MIEQTEALPEFLFNVDWDSPNVKPLTPLDVTLESM